MQVGVFAATLCTTTYAPLSLITGWLKPVATYNPVTQILLGTRQGLIDSVSWSHTWPGLVAVAGMALFFGAFALRGLSRAGL